jgi:hypothetical protein
VKDFLTIFLIPTISAIISSLFVIKISQTKWFMATGSNMPRPNILKPIFIIVGLLALGYLLFDDITSKLSLKSQIKANTDLVLLKNNLIDSLNNINKQKEKIKLTAQLISLEHAKFQSDSLIAELKFTNHSDEDCYIPNNMSHNMFCQPKNTTFNFAAIDTYTHQRFSEFSIGKHSEINKSCLFNLKPLLDDNKRRQDSGYPVSDTCKIGIWAHCFGESDTGNIINDIVITTQNGKIIDKDISRSKKPVLLIDK